MTPTRLPNKITALDAAMTILLHAQRHRRRASEFWRSAFPCVYGIRRLRVSSDYISGRHIPCDAHGCLHLGAGAWHQGSCVPCLGVGIARLLWQRAVRAGGILCSLGAEV